MTPEQFKARYQQFSTEGVSRVQMFLDEAATEMDEARWGELFARGHGLLTAHNLTLANQESATSNGAVADLTTQKKVGDVSVSRSEAMLQTQAGDPLMRTTYGQEFKRLRRLIGVGAWAV